MSRYTTINRLDYALLLFVGGSAVLKTANDMEPFTAHPTLAHALYAICVLLFGLIVTLILWWSAAKQIYLWLRARLEERERAQ